jgi:hypothetical protein
MDLNLISLITQQNRPEGKLFKCQYQVDLQQSPQSCMIFSISLLLCIQSAIYLEQLLEKYIDSLHPSRSSYETLL